MMTEKHLTKVATVGLTVGFLLAGAGLWTGSAATAGNPPTPVTSTQAATTQASHKAKIVKVTMHIVSGEKKLEGQEQPYFTNPAWQKTSGGPVAAGDIVKLTIVSNDDGPAPAPAYTKVKGTVRGTETINGKTVSEVAAKRISHTFTVPALGLNLPIPAAPEGRTVTVSATIKVTKAGAFNWQCFAPCGSGSSGWGGAMVTNGWMKGTISIKKA